MSDWKYITDELPPFDVEVHLAMLGDKLQTQRPKRLDTGKLDRITAHGPVFTQWDCYMSRSEEVNGDVYAWRYFPELPDPFVEESK